jgi:hypothetical protein
MGSAVGRVAVPLVAYYGVALVLPLANGAAQDARFADHARVVLVVPLALVALACAARLPFRAALACRRP